MSKKNLSILVLIPILSACSASLLYSPDVRLSPVKVSSENSGLTVPVPFGWYEVTNNTGVLTDIFLVNDSQSAAISFNPVNSELITALGMKPEIERIRDLLISFIKADPKRELRITTKETFEINGNDFSCFEYRTTGTAHGRTVAFKIGDKFYECTAELNENGTNKLSSPELFSIQNSILRSISK